MMDQEPGTRKAKGKGFLTSGAREDSIPPMVRHSATLLGTLVLFALAGCAQTDPGSVCQHIAGLQQSGSAAKDYVRRCIKPMNEARLNQPDAYRCWSKCVVEVKAWPDSARCDHCLTAKMTEFDLFQYTKARQKQEDARKAQQAPSASAPAPSDSVAPPAATPSSPAAAAPAASMCGDSQPCK